MDRYQEPEMCLKVLLIGSQGVGKTSLILRYVDKDYIFSCIHNQTVQVDIKSITRVVQDRNIKVNIWDTPGQVRFAPVTKVALRKSDAVIIVYDITDRQTFEDLDKWIQLVDLYCPEAEIILVGNKCEPDVKRQVTYAEARTFAKDAKLNVIEASVKLPQHIEEVFTEIIERAAKKKGLNEVNDPEISDTEAIQLQSDDAETPRQKSGCKCKK